MSPPTATPTHDFLFYWSDTFVVNKNVNSINKTPTSKPVFRGLYQELSIKGWEEIIERNNTSAAT